MPSEVRGGDRSSIAAAVDDVGCTARVDVGSTTRVDTVVGASLDTPASAVVSVVVGNIDSVGFGPGTVVVVAVDGVSNPPGRVVGDVISGAGRVDTGICAAADKRPRRTSSKVILKYITQLFHSDNGDETDSYSLRTPPVRLAPLLPYRFARPAGADIGG